MSETNDATTTTDAAASTTATATDAAQGLQTNGNAANTDASVNTDAGNANQTDAAKAAPIDPKMVVPETAEGYSLPVPEGDDGAFAKTASQWFHEAGIPPAQAEKLAAKWNEFSAAQQKAYQEAEAAKEAQAEAKFKEEDGALRKEWGAKYDANIELGKRAYREFGFTEDIVNAVEDKVGPAALLKIFANIGAKIGEDSAVGINSAQGMTYQSAATALYGENGQ